MRYRPDFETECSECGRTPTVVVINHIHPSTELCGYHFFLDRKMVDWQLWNDDLDDDTDDN